MSDDQKVIDGVQEAINTTNEAVETAKESVKEATDESKVDMTPEQKKIVDQIESMSVLELNKLVKVLEEKFGVSAQAVVVTGAGAAAGAAAEEKDSFNVELKSAGEQKVQVIKAIKEALGLGLKEAKDLVDAAPSLLKEGLKKADADALKTAIEAAGGQVELK